MWAVAIDIPQLQSLPADAANLAASLLQAAAACWRWPCIPVQPRTKLHYYTAATAAASQQTKTLLTRGSKPKSPARLRTDSRQGGWGQDLLACHTEGLLMLIASPGRQDLLP